MQTDKQTDRQTCRQEDSSEAVRQSQLVSCDHVLHIICVSRAVHVAVMPEGHQAHASHPCSALHWIAPKQVWRKTIFTDSLHVVGNFERKPYSNQLLVKPVWCLVLNVGGVDSNTTGALLWSIVNLLAQKL